MALNATVCLKLCHLKDIDARTFVVSKEKGGIERKV
jgi:hypothetical protein